MASIEIQSSILKSKCEKYLANRKAYITQRKDKEIKKLVGKRTFWLFGDKFTYETAKVYLDKHADNFHEYYLCELSGGGRSLEAEDLLALTKHNDTVTLTDEDIWIMEY